MYRLFKSIDKIGGNGDGVVTEEEYKSAFDSPLATDPDAAGWRGDVTATSGGMAPQKGLPYLTGPLLYTDPVREFAREEFCPLFDPERARFCGKSG